MRGNADYSPNRADPRPRLLVIVNVFEPDRGGGGAVFSDLCYELADRGFEVTVRCAYPYYPEWKDKSGKNGLRIRRFSKGKLAIERYGIFIPSNPNSLLQRMLYEASFFLSLLRSLHRGSRFDVVMVFCPLVGAVGFAALNQAIYGKPLWLNVQDLSADAAAASGISKGHTVNRILAGFQKLLFNRADVWSSISPIMIRRLEEIRSRQQPVLYLPNWLNESLRQHISALPSKEGRALHDPIRLLYAGNIGTKQDLLKLCQVLQKVDQSFHFQICGDGGEAEALRQAVKATGDKRFSFGPFLDETAFSLALHEADFFVVTEKSGSGGSFIPSKLMPGIASGTPILAVCDEETPLGQEMKQANPGPWFSWEMIDQIPSFLQTVHLAPERCLAWQRAALRRAEFFDRGTIIDRYATALERVAAGMIPEETSTHTTQIFEAA